MRRNLFTFVAMLAALATGFEAHAACTAANPNANVIESTPTSALTDNGNGTVTHNLTGLIWKQCAEGLSGASCATGSATTFTWANALIQAKNANFAGQTDWRLPNLKELESIVESCGYSPSINQTRFPATPASLFWSSSSYVPNPANAWVVYFYDGDTGANNKTGSYYARLVRGGQSFDAFDAQAPAGDGGGGDPTPGPTVTILINGQPAGGDIVITGVREVQARSHTPVKVDYTLSESSGLELFVVVQAPALGIHWSYLDAAGTFIPLPPPDYSQITPYKPKGLAPGTYTLYNGPLPAGVYELYIAVDFVANGHLDYQYALNGGRYAYARVRVF